MVNIDSVLKLDLKDPHAVINYLLQDKRVVKKYPKIKEEMDTNELYELCFEHVELEKTKLFLSTYGYLLIMIMMIFHLNPCYINVIQHLRKQLDS